MKLRYFFCLTLLGLFSLSTSIAQTTVPIYSQFDEIEYIFQQENDTTYVINFWATWCKPCVDELPYIEQLHEVYGEEKLKVILVSLDFKTQIESKLIPFIEKNQLKSEVLVLTDGKYNVWIDKVSPEWDGAIPVTLIYKGENRAFINTNFHSFEELDKIVKPIISGK